MALAGTYKLSLTTPMGPQTLTLTLAEEGGQLSGSMSGELGSAEFTGGTIDGDSASWEMNFSAMGQEIKLDCSCAVDGDSISGKLSSSYGPGDFTGQREG